MAENLSSNNTQAIDVVIAWVDGKDTVLKEKRDGFLNNSESSGINSVVLPTHFASNDEIKYCVLSIMRFASFVRNIYIVTDGQDPGLNDIIMAKYPERKDSVRIVDHKEIFEGYEEYLPTFNSISIGNMVWRIKGLSDNFVYFNDDVILIREHKPEDWFINNRPVLRGKWLLPPLKKILRIKLKSFFFVKLKFRTTYHPRISFYVLQWKVARMLGMKYRYYFICHTPHPLRRNMLEKFFADNRKMMEKNISYRFRNSDQILMSSLAYHLEIRSGNRNISKLNLEYIHPTYSIKRLYRKIAYSENNPKIKSVAIQSVDMFREVEQENIFKWLDRLMGSQKTQDQ